MSSIKKAFYKLLVKFNAGAIHKLLFNEQQIFHRAVYHYEIQHKTNECVIYGVAKFSDYKHHLCWVVKRIFINDLQYDVQCAQEIVDLLNNI